jgi:hypothetical protein
MNSALKLAAAVSLSLALVGCHSRPDSPAPTSEARGARATEPTDPVVRVGTGSSDGVMFGSCASGCTQTQLLNAVGAAAAACLIADQSGCYGGACRADLRVSPPPMKQCADGATMICKRVNGTMGTHTCSGCTWGACN